MAPAAALTVEQLDIQKSEALIQLTDPAQRLQAQELYQQAKTSLDGRADYRAKIDKLRNQSLHHPEIRRALQDELTQLERSESSLPVTQRERTLQADALENLIARTRAERASAEADLATHELQLRTLTMRPTELTKEKMAVSARLAAIDSARSQIGTDAINAIGRARLAAFDAEMEARQAQLESLKLEELGHENSTEIVQLRRELSLRNLERLSARMTALDEVLIKRRQVSASHVQATAEKAGAQTESMLPAAQAIVKESEREGRELEKLVTAQSDAVRHRGEYADSRQQLNADYEIARQRLQIAGASSVLGRILVDQRRHLPRISQLLQQSKSNAAEVTNISLRRIELEERLRSVLQDEETPAALFDTGAETAAPPSADQLKGVQTLLEAQEGLLKNLDTNYAAYLRVLDAAESELQQLIKTVAGYTALLDQRLLWIPNATPWSFELAKDCLRLFRSFSRPDLWRGVVDDFVFAVQAKTLALISLCLLVLGLYRARRRFRAFLAASGSFTSQASMRMRDILSGLWLTGVIMLPGPMVCLALSFALKVNPEATETSLSLSQTLLCASYLLVVALWWQEALSERGVMARYFGVPRVVCRESRATWRMFTRVFVPTYSLALNFVWPGAISTQNGVGRLLFFVAMLSLVAFVYWLTRRKSPVSPFTMNQSHEGTRPLWQAVLIVPPIIFAGISFVGYHYTAIELSRYYLQSCLLLAGSLLAYHLAIRWVQISGARFLAEMCASTSEAQEAPDRRAELEKFETQAKLVSRNLVGWIFALGLVGIWQTVLPALAVFDQISLWEITTRDVNGTISTQAVTIASLVLAAVIALVTFIASQNIPGVIEIGLLQRTKMKHGSRYAMSSLLQYAIVAVGVSLALRTLGMRWSQVQWLVAALGVGLGFGLQEIFANFVSGIILLFERPIRVGDVVTIADLTGKVSRIRIRATTIRDFDNKEIIVPNKTFITDRFVNWTLSDQVTRVVLKVSIAYGSDIDLAMRLLIDLANIHPKIMCNPPPQAVLTGFGDSGLTIDLMVYVEELLHRIDVRHDLTARIETAFREHGIEIPVPKRDVRLRNNNSVETVTIEDDGID